jgi:ActR/RegA family two-component response regulator
MHDMRLSGPPRPLGRPRIARWHYRPCEALQAVSGACEAVTHIGKCHALQRIMVIGSTAEAATATKAAKAAALESVTRPSG